MNTATRAALSRTLLLMRDELVPSVEDGALLGALTGTSVVLAANEQNLRSYAAQVAFVTSALLMARSGHQVFLAAPDVPLIGKHPPLVGSNLVTALLQAGLDLIPGVTLAAGQPDYQADLEVRFGDSQSASAHRSIALYASAWHAAILRSSAPWPQEDWPLGALAAAALAAGEAFKIAMLKLEGYAQNRDSFAARFAPFIGTFELAPEDTAQLVALGQFDVVSGGAIANALLYCVSRIRGVHGRGRVIDFDRGDLSNLNRNMLMLRKDVPELKVDVLARCFTEEVIVRPVPLRYDPASTDAVLPLAPFVLVGVDDIPTRWLVQKSKPTWLGVGATSHWSAMASYHTEATACARCLHPADEEANGPIPTVAFVSFWAGLLLCVYFLRALAGKVAHQQSYITPLRPELPWYSPVSRRPDCPICRARGRSAGALKLAP